MARENKRPISKQGQETKFPLKLIVCPKCSVPFKTENNWGTTLLDRRRVHYICPNCGEHFEAEELDFPRPEVCVVDIETSGLDPIVDDILEIGVVVLNAETGDIKEVFSEIIECQDANPKSWVFQNSDLTVEQVKEGTPLESIKEKIQLVFNQYPVTAYNREFDFGFLVANGFEIPRSLQCIMLAATPILKLPRRRYGYKWPKFQEAWEHYFPENDIYQETHRACDDAHHEAELLFEMIQRGDYKYKGTK